MPLLTRSRRPSEEARICAESGAALAELCRSVLSIAIATRQLGRCMGDVRADDLELTHAGMRVMHPGRGIRGLLIRSDRLRRAHRHRVAGHVAGCEELGISLTVITALMEQWDRVGASGLVCEAISDAQDEIAASTLARGEWEATDAWEIVHLQLGRRFS